VKPSSTKPGSPCDLSRAGVHHPDHLDQQGDSHSGSSGAAEGRQAAGGLGQESFQGSFWLPSPWDLCAVEATEGSVRDTSRAQAEYPGQVVDPLRACGEITAADERQSPRASKGIDRRPG